MKTSIARDVLLKEFARRGPWSTKFIVDGHSYGGDYFVEGDERITQFLDAFPNSKSILDLGALEGGHSVVFAQHLPLARIVAIEGRPSNFEKACWIKEAVNAHNLELVCENLEEMSLATLGSFDAVFCVGLLYHLPKPWELLQRLAAASSRLFLWTHYAREGEANLLEDGYRGSAYREFGWEDPYSGLSPSSFWPTRETLFEMLEQTGFVRHQIIRDDPSFSPGPAITLVATVDNDRHAAT
ncbi:MAG: class I SAM-dependent methyltransferase [Chthoniobacterales bacterium]